MVAAQLIIRAPVGGSQIEILESLLVGLDAKGNPDESASVGWSSGTWRSRDVTFDRAVHHVRIAQEGSDVIRWTLVVRRWDEVKGAASSIVHDLGAAVHHLQAVHRPKGPLLNRGPLAHCLSE